MFDIACTIFAGGKSSRMGQDKSLLPFGDAKSLTEYQFRNLSQLFREVYISTKEAKFDFDAPLITDVPHEGYAPTAGFVSIFQQLQYERVFVISVDTPFISKEVIATLLQEDHYDLDATIARSPEGLHPMCGIYHHSLLPAFEEMLATNKHKLGMLLKNRNTKEVLFDSDAPFANLNHPHEYEAALQRL